MTLHRPSARPEPGFRAAFPLLLAPLLLGLVTCAPASESAESRADQATLNACRQHADDVYLEQNRQALYQSSNSVTPYTAGPTTGLPTAGLSGLFARDQLVNDCVRNTGTQTQRAVPGGQAATATPSVTVPAQRAGAGGATP